MDINDARKLRALEAENRQLKRLVADLILDNQILKDLLEKNSSRPKRSEMPGTTLSPALGSAEEGPV